MSDTFFDSRNNYLKIFMQGSGTLARPATLDAGNAEYYSEVTITHNLGYIPLVRAWYEPAGDGMKYAMNGQKRIAASEIYIQDDVEFMFYADSITDTTVTFRAARESGDGALTDTFTYWYKIYIDPSEEL